MEGLNQWKRNQSFLISVNTGMYVLNPNLLNEIPKDTFFHMTHLSDKLLSEGRKVGMYPISEDSFLDMESLKKCIEWRKS